MTEQRLAWLLGNWADYMKQDTHRLGYPSKSVMLASGGGSCDDEFEIMCEEVDIKCAQSLDSIIDSITKPQRTAVNHIWLKVEYHYPTQDLDLAEAYDNITRLCIKRGVI